jgi:single-stranded DNA-binding protein
MAEISFTAFIEETVANQQGDVFVLKTAEPHSKKNDQERWETVSRTFRDVKVSREAGIQLAQFVKDERIYVTGTEKTETRTDATGKKHYSLVVWATSITRAGQAPTAVAEPVDAWSTPGGFGDDSLTPF